MWTEFEVSGIRYWITSTSPRTCEVIRNGNKYNGAITIPSSVVYNGASYTVTSLRSEVFYNQNITSISIPNTVTKIGNWAFNWCRSLSSIELPNSVTTVGQGAFSYSNISSVNLGKGLQTIGIDAFYGCSNLTSLTIPASVTSIGDGAFSGCYNLSSVFITDLAAWCRIQFANGASNPLSYAQNLYLNGELVKDLVIPNSVTCISNYAFYRCADLTSIIIPESVTGIGDDAFYGCTSLGSIIVDINNNNYCSVDGVLYDKNKSTLVRYPILKSGDDYEIPNSVINIKSYAFQGCMGLTSLSIPSSVATIGDYAFQNCTNLTEIANYSKVPQQISANTFSTFGNLRVPKGSGLAYSNATYWKNFNVIDGLTLDLDLADGTPFVNSTNVLYDQLTYTRNFTSDNWQALYVPFAMQYEDWAADFEVARLNDVHQFDDDEDGEIDRTVLEVVKMKEGSATEPNTPYMIKAKEVGEKIITLNNTTLYATVENSVDVTSWNSKFTFTGTYSTVTDMATKGHYALANGGLMQASSDAATLSAFRWYLDVTDRNGNPAPLKAKKVLLSFDGGEETAIDLVEANEDANAGSIYSISGVKVGTGRTSLSKGLYISNGKKYLIK